MKGDTPKTKRPAPAYTLEHARAAVLEKVTAKGAAGAGSPVTAAAKESKRSLLEQAVAELESERAVFVDRTGAKPKFFLARYAPTVASVRDKIDQFSALKHPELLTAAQLGKAISKAEQPLFGDAFEQLEAERRLLKLRRGKSVVFAHGESLRAMLGGISRAESEPTSPVSSNEVRKGYHELVRLTGFPDVEIAALQRQAGVPIAALKAWVLAEHRAGRAVFGLGDWSLADDATRAGVIELRGDRYLLVRLEA